MSDSVPTVLPALAVVAVLTGSMVIGVYIASGASTRFSSATARLRRVRGKQAQTPAARRISPVAANERLTPWNSDDLHVDLPSVGTPAPRVVAGYELLRQRQSPAAAMGSTSSGRAPVDHGADGAPLQRPQQLRGPVGTSPYPDNDW